MEFSDLKVLASKMGMNMEQLAGSVGMSRQGLQKTIEQKNLRIETAVSLAKVLRQDPGVFLLSFIEDYKSEEKIEDKHFLKIILEKQDQILKLLQKKTLIETIEI